MRTIFLLLTFLILSAAAEMRVWTDIQDRKVEAEMIAANDDFITLRLKDGREVPFPTERLSEDDVKYVEDNRDKLDMPAAGGISGARGEDEEKLNFGDPWPDRVTFTEDPEIVTIEENAGEKRFIYESANYRYVCDVRLAKSVVKGFAVMFEATHLCARTLPLGITHGQKTDGKYLILLFEELEDYVKAGGLPGSAGVFMGGRGIVMVPLTSLGVRPLGSGYMLDRDKAAKRCRTSWSIRSLPAPTMKAVPAAGFRKASPSMSPTLPIVPVPIICGPISNPSSNTPPPMAKRTWEAARPAPRSAFPR